MNYNKINLDFFFFILQSNQSAVDHQNELAGFSFLQAKLREEKTGYFF
jgi:hypothetical protein